MPDREALWTALRDVVLFWVEQGVRIFRVDNPHTKPFPFWEWLIREVQSVDPDVIFLSEAFTRPKVMKALAKLGFSQSYTYFTWRTGKEELQAYLSEITAIRSANISGRTSSSTRRTSCRSTCRAASPGCSRRGWRWPRRCRATTASTTASSCWSTSRFRDKEEYLDSEKYELKTRDWDKPGNIKDYIGRLNRLRQDNAALLQTSNLRFAQVDDGEVIGFVKESAAGDNAVAVAVALDQAGSARVLVPFRRHRDRSGGRAPPCQIDRKSGHRRAPHLEWGGVRLRIDQERDPALLFRCLS